MPGYYITYRGCIIDWDARHNTYVWDEPEYGMQSEGRLATVQAAKRDIDRFITYEAPATDFMHTMEVS